MSSVLVEYPEGLPAPTTGEVRPTERRAISGVGQMRNTRAIQRDRHGTRTIAFTFTPEQAAIFREWWVEWLQLGGGWFAANWPLPWSRGPNVFRFTDPPQWQLIGGRLDGQGYWQVRATCEIRGRGMLPTAEVMYLTSTPYPIDYQEASSISDNSVYDGKIYAFPAEKSYTSENIYIEGSLRDRFVKSGVLEMSVISGFDLFDGSLINPANFYEVPYESAINSEIEFIPGELRNRRIDYKNYKSDKSETSDFNFIGGDLT